MRLGLGMKKSLRIGSKIVEKGKVYRVFKIDKKKLNGKTERIIHYRPFFKNQISQSFECSIPESNMEEANIRRPVSKKRARELMKSLSKGVRITKPLNVTKAKDALKLNDIEESIGILKRYWEVRSRDEDGFTKSKKDVLESAMNRVIEELALVNRVSPDTAEKRVKTALN